MKKVLVVLLLLGLTACNSNQIAMVESTVVTTVIETTNRIDETTETENKQDFDETTIENIAESSEELIEETSKWSSYSDEIRVILEKYEGKDYQTSRKITNEELNKIHSVGLYMYTNNVTSTRGADDITRKSGGSTEFVSKSEFEKVVAQSYNETDGLLTNIAYNKDEEAYNIMKNTVDQILKNKSKAKVEAKQKLAESYVKVNTDPNSPAKYINGLGDGQYTIKFGLVVPSTPVDVHDPASNYSYIPKENFETFCKTEVLCFQKNNEGKIINVIGKQPKVKYGVNTYNQYGDPVWIIREQNAECVDAYGDTLYAHVKTALPEYYDKCGGTDMQFVGWSHVPATLPPDYAYNLYKQGVFTIKNMGAVLTDPEWAYPD